MFKVTENVIGKLAYSTCYALVAVYYRETQIEALQTFLFFCVVADLQYFKK